MLAAYGLVHALSLPWSHALSSFNVDSHRWPDASDASALATATRHARALPADLQPRDTPPLASARGHRLPAAGFPQKARAWSERVSLPAPPSRPSAIVAIGFSP